MTNTQMSIWTRLSKMKMLSEKTYKLVSQITKDYIGQLKQFKELMYGALDLMDMKNAQQDIIQDMLFHVCCDLQLMLNFLTSMYEENKDERRNEEPKS